MEIGVRLRVGSVLAIAVFALTFLGACGGEGPALTAQEYAEAMEDARAAMEEDGAKIEEDLEQAFEGAFEKMEDAPPPEGPWSDDDAEVATELAKTLLRAYIDAFEGSREALGDYGEAISRLRPPEHLADLHNAMTASLEELVRAIGKFVEDLEDIDTDIDSEAELEAFGASLESVVGSDSTSPGEQMEEACRALEARLQAELGASVAICE